MNEKGDLVYYSLALSYGFRLSMMMHSRRQGPLPGYISLHRQGILAQRIEEAISLLEWCHLCPRACGAHRLRNQPGFCGAGRWAKVASANLHWGEEPPLVGEGGSGTIFFSHCSLRCCFCQNYPLSHLGNGRMMDAAGLARVMLGLQERGAINLNLVTASHYLPQILEALPLAIEGGLRLPLVHNCGGYESEESLRLLEGIVDIYLPDAKYGEVRWARLYSQAPDYVEVNRRALREMYRQVGRLRVDRKGRASRGLIIRHLILPGHPANTRKVLSFLASELGPSVHVSLMSQYFPAHEAFRYPSLRRKVSPGEVRQALQTMEELGLQEGWHQEGAAAGGEAGELED